MSIKSQLQSTAPEGGKPVVGQDLMDLTRFAPDTHHMIVFDALTWDCPVGGKGERVRVFLTDEGYKQAIDAQEHGQIKVVRHARVRKGYIYYDAPERDLEEY